MKFKGKVGIWFWLIIMGMNVLFLYELLFSQDDVWVLIIGTVLLNLIFLPMMIRNDVVIENGKVVVHIGFIMDFIEVKDIVEVYRTRNPIASSALSLDRIVIKGRRQEIICAVRERERFFEELRKAKPEIKFR